MKYVQVTSNVRSVSLSIKSGVASGLRPAAQQVAQSAKRHATPNTDTGKLVQSIRGRKVSKFVAEVIADPQGTNWVGNNVHYALFLHNGHRAPIVAYPGNPFLTKAMVEQKDNVERIVRDTIKQVLP
jgi:hypothetical protein